MARIDLVRVRKTLRREPPPGLTSLIAPALALTPAAREAAVLPGAPRGPFSIRDLSLTVPDGRVMVVLGPSGCGKSTLLRLIAGLIQPDSGQVLYDGRDMAGVAPGDRRIGMVFQNYALYPHMTSHTNVLSYFMFRKRTAELDAEAADKYRRTSELMGVELEYLLDRKPGNLSGGEKQRVALARCITRDPAVFLLDEPFSNLDQKLREKFRLSLKVLLGQFRITTIYVTHDQHEALLLADLLSIMDDGAIAQTGTWQEIYDRPESLFVADFLNPYPDVPALNVIPASALSASAQMPYTGRVTIGVRPDDVTIAVDDDENAAQAFVTGLLALPPRGTTILSARIGACEIQARLDRMPGCRPGDSIRLHFARYHVFDQPSGARLRTITTEKAELVRLSGGSTFDGDH